MSTPDIQRTDPKLLSRLLGAPEAPDQWQADDLAAMLRHQLAAPLAVDLPGAAAVLTPADPPMVSFRDLLWHPHPPVELLNLLKSFAKSAADQAMPQDLASFFYFSSIAVAAARTGQSISSLTPARLREGLLWCLRQPWLDDATRALIMSLVSAE